MGQYGSYGIYDLHDPIYHLGSPIEEEIVGSTEDVMAGLAERMNPHYLDSHMLKRFLNALYQVH